MQNLGQSSYFSSQVVFSFVNMVAVSELIAFVKLKEHRRYEIDKGPELPGVSSL